MAAKNKRSYRPAAPHGSREMQQRAMSHRDELLQEARSLLADGRVREARAVEKRAGQVERLVGALETELYPTGRPLPS
jgi:hypothetical protein